MFNARLPIKLLRRYYFAWDELKKIQGSQRLPKKTLSGFKKLRIFPTRWNRCTAKWGKSSVVLLRSHRICVFTVETFQPSCRRPKSLKGNSLQVYRNFRICNNIKLGLLCFAAAMIGEEKRTNPQVPPKRKMRLEVVHISPLHSLASLWSEDSVYIAIRTFHSSNVPFFQSSMHTKPTVCASLSAIKKMTHCVQFACTISSASGIWIRDEFQFCRSVLVSSEASACAKLTIRILVLYDLHRTNGDTRFW